jgi:hypothetical protein
MRCSADEDLLQPGLYPTQHGYPSMLRKCTWVSQDSGPHMRLGRHLRLQFRSCASSVMPGARSAENTHSVGHRWAIDAAGSPGPLAASRTLSCDFGSSKPATSLSESPTSCTKHCVRGASGPLPSSHCVLTLLPSSCLEDMPAAPAAACARFAHLPTPQCCPLPTGSMQMPLQDHPAP